MKYIIFFFLLGVSLCCKDSKTKGSFKKENFNEHYIDAAKGTLLLPFEYKKVTQEQLPYLIAKKDSVSVLKRLRDMLEADRRDYELFSNENDLNDAIFIVKSEFINFSKKDASQYLGLLEASMSKIYSSGNYIRLQEKISQTERSKYMKFKYEIRLGETRFYQTQYIVTSKATTFGVFELRTSITDNEDLIKRINYLVN